MQKNIKKVEYRIKIQDRDTLKFLDLALGLPKLPIITQGDLGFGKTTLLKFLADIYLCAGKKLIVPCDSIEMESFEFVEHYPTLWLLPLELQGVYFEKHPNLTIEYIDLDRYGDVFRIIQTAKEDVIIATHFFPILLNAFTDEDFKFHFPSFPECVLLMIELSRAFKARHFQKSKNIQAGDLLRQIRHAGTNGFNLLADTQVLEDVDIVFRRVGGVIILFKRMTLYKHNPLHNHLMLQFPRIETKIRNLTRNEFVAVLGNKRFYCKNKRPSFSQNNFQLSNYFMTNPSIDWEESRVRKRDYQKHMKEILNPKEEKDEGGRRMLPSEYKKFYRWG